MRRLFICFIVLQIALLAPGGLTGVSLAQTAPAPAQSAASAGGGIQITWEVRNRFRLFREERDFLIHTEALSGRSILSSEDALEAESEGRGWARNTMNRLCIDATGRIAEPCTRDGVKESYLTPTDHAVTMRMTGPVPVGGICAWSIDDGDGSPRQLTLDCSEVVNFRARYGRPTAVSVDITAGTDAPQHVTEQIMVRDILIAGLGDSIASGEGNPDRPVALADDGFCFRSYLGASSAQYYRPSRAGYKGSRACDTPDASSNTMQGWLQLGAHWFNAACHRSLYSYQTRTALALATQYPHIAVTYLPLACSGATINEGLLGPLRARECLFTKTAMNCEGVVRPQIAELRETLAAAQRRQPDRQLDLVLLTIGANDMNFSGLVANVIVDQGLERALFQRAGIIGSLDDSRARMARDLPQGFRRLRDALRPLIGGDLSRVVFVSYGNPALANGGPCPGGPSGFDVQPSFNADPQRLTATAAFVQNEFLPQIKNLASCTGGVLCNGNGDVMTFVDSHQASFENHGFCARAATDPQFDQQCFSAKGGSFNPDIVAAANNPMTCGAAASDFRAYLPRARWIRDANDSYFTAMTYPLAAKSAAQPSDIHDATWGVLSAVYGGAIHPTAEGHAVMADAALPAAATVLGLGTPDTTIVREPIAPVQQ
ncbi:MAG: hypothetical protein EKK40_11935 [Bradyrhizobiaceae bacterium]|nr:MAG: hypothetical protein EKK40_11935 [Bradyrhizobiaceae bacterium]